MKDILFVADVQNWAFDITAKCIQKYLPCDILYCSDEPRFKPEITTQYKHVHFFNWLNGQECAGRDNVSAGVCQHNFEIKWADIASKYIGRFKKMVAISRELESLIKKINSNTYYIPNAVDEELFKPVERNINEPFTVGWTAQATSGGFGEKKSREGRKVWDIKCYELLLLPLMERLKDKVKFKVCSNTHENAIPYSEMPENYHDIDCHICTAMYEGGPFPVLEASACGKPVISTKVGIVPELIKEGHNGFLIDNIRSREDIPRALNAFENRILMLKEHRELAQLMGGKNREEILKSWTWEKVIPLWREFFGKDKTT